MATKSITGTILSVATDKSSTRGVITLKHRSGLLSRLQTESFLTRRIDSFDDGAGKVTMSEAEALVGQKATIALETIFVDLNRKMWVVTAVTAA